MVLTLLAPRPLHALAIFAQTNVYFLRSNFHSELIYHICNFLNTENGFISFIRSPGNKAYLLKTDIGKVPVYCHMTGQGIGACGGGGWTLVMKTDGHKV